MFVHSLVSFDIGKPKEPHSGIASLIMHDVTICLHLEEGKNGRLNLTEIIKDNNLDFYHYQCFI